MLRNRDMVAALFAVILSRMAWNSSTESLSASAQLAFFLPRDGAKAFSPMDIDGDGTNEALAVMTRTPTKSWALQILDLKPLHQFTKTFLAPFRPKVLFTSEELRENDAIPIKLATGQILVKKGMTKKTKYELPEGVDINDKNRNYFCGEDWHDASQKCGTPCPGGQASECPGTERCFADTPCNALSTKSHEDTQVLFHLTPGGGLPSLVTLWSNGAMTMHSLTSDKASIMGLSGETKGKERKRDGQDLGLRLMWHAKLLPNVTSADAIFWMESNILFLDAESSHEAAADHGMVVVSGLYVDEGLDPPARSSFAVALDAMSGEVIWESFPDKEKDEAQLLPFPAARGYSSYARRRSRIPSLEHGRVQGNAVEGLPSCMVTLKQHFREVMPYAYWGAKDSKIQALHLDLQSKSRDKSNHMVKPATNGKASHQKRNGHHKHKKPSVLYGRPNMLVSHTSGGLEIRSMKNGMALCHLSLLESTVYSDLNNDGILDQVQVLLESTQVDPSDAWVWDLASKLQQNREDLKEKGAQKQLLNSNPNLCHAMALSGLPPKEELFTSPLCGSVHERIGNHPAASMDTVTPLVVESLNGRRNTRDLIIALNNGMLHRLHGGNGRREWMLNGKHHEDFPTWELGSNQNALLTRVHVTGIAPAIRPVLLAGENSLAIVSVKNGGVLASVPFPQTSIVRPELADLSGDGSVDLVTMSSDGIWGFQIKVHSGAPIFARVMSGLLMMLLMLAVLRNRFADKKDMRATDDYTR
jgi:hypothetical protein